MAGGAGMMAGLGNLFENKLFLQMLSGAGAKIAGPDSVAASLDQFNQQAITNQNFSSLLSKILGEGGKMTMDGDKTKIDMPTNLTGALGNNQSQGSNISGSLNGPGQSGNLNMISNQGGALPNPFQMAL